MAIANNKKRYQITFTQENMDWLIQYLRSHGQPRTVITAMLDDYIAATVETFKALEQAEIRTGKTATYGDFITSVGNLIKKREQRELDI